MCTSALSLWWAPRLPPISSNPKKSHDKHLYGPTGYIFQSFSQVREHVHAQSQQLPDCFPEWQSQLRHSLQKCPRVPSSTLHHYLPPDTGCSRHSKTEAQSRCNGSPGTIQGSSSVSAMRGRCCRRTGQEWMIWPTKPKDATHMHSLGSLVDI